MFVNTFDGSVIGYNHSCTREKMHTFKQMKSDEIYQEAFGGLNRSLEMSPQLLQITWHMSTSFLRSQLKKLLCQDV